MGDTLARRLVRSLDSWEIAAKPFDGDVHKADWGRVIPFVALHLACLLVLIVGWSPVAVIFAVAFYGLRMFAITAFYHRYFSHRAFKTSRAMQFVFAVLGLAAVQKGPLWWAAHHRNHHRHSDHEGDVHSPQREGLWYSHVGWILSRQNLRTRLELVGDLAKFPELRFLDRFDLLVPILLIPLLFGVGVGLQAFWPGLGTSGMQFLVWGFVISTVALYHGTFTINSLAHRLGTRRFDTPDDSRNNAFLSLLTFGEGWHNNHHHYPGSVRMGFRWWEFDLSFYLIRAMAVMGLVWDLRPIPVRLKKP
ncbi:MAG: stearoyl-CoA desaturase (delta-9 desaturase) [Planctomycetota bacterium]|jgi:stearoyl-CoA desaturase (delta-9 desaturase)